MDPEKKKRLILKKAKESPVFFAEHFLIDPQMKYYTLEPQQKAFLEDPSDNRIFFCSRRSGKTLTLIIDLLHKAFFNPSRQVGLIAPTLKQATAFANVMNDMILRSPLIQSSFITNNKFDKQLSNLSRISFQTAGAKSGQAEDSGLVGSGYHVLYLDEIQSMNAEALGTILPIITGQVGNAKLCFSGTPRGRAGFFWDLLQNAFQVTEYYENNGKPKPLKDGAFKMAAKSRVPVLPIFITMEDSNLVGDDGFTIQEYTINIGKPIYPNKKLSEKENTKSMKEKNAEVWKEVYEDFYKVPLTYTTPPEKMPN